MFILFLVDNEHQEVIKNTSGNMLNSEAVVLALVCKKTWTDGCRLPHILGNDALHDESVSLVQVRLFKYAAYKLTNFLYAKRCIEMVIRLVKMFDDFFIDTFCFRQGFRDTAFLERLF